MSTNTLAPTLVRIPAALREALLVSVGVLFIALSAQVVIPLPFTPVPITGQTFAALLVGGAYGAVRSVGTLLAYLAVGAIGFPVFAEGSHGFGVITAATGGYLIGMVVASGVVGAAAERRMDRKLLSSVLAMLVGTVIIYAIGASWLAVSLHVSAGKAFELGARPFIIGDLIKLAIAGSLLPAAWKLTRAS